MGDNETFSKDEIQALTGLNQGSGLVTKYQGVSLKLAPLNSCNSSKINRSIKARVERRDLATCICTSIRYADYYWAGERQWSAGNVCESTAGAATGVTPGWRKGKGNRSWIVNRFKGCSDF